MIYKTLHRPMQSVPINTNVVSSNPARARCTRQSIQQCAIKLSVTRGMSVLFSGTPISSTNKTNHHDTAEILLKVLLNTIVLTPNPHAWSCGKVMRGDSVVTSIRCPESQEGACESMKGPIALPRKFYFDIFIIGGGGYFQLYLELI